jgi:dTDP-4-dehydrorhamnose reductase
MTAGGAISWHGFASAIRERRYGEAAKQGPRLIPIGTAEYPTPAKRPLNSVLSNAKLESRFGLAQTDWESLLTECMTELTDSAPAKHA